jgi:hypothetical protein
MHLIGLDGAYWLDPQHRQRCGRERLRAAHAGAGGVRARGGAGCGDSSSTRATREDRC